MAGNVRAVILSEALGTEQSTVSILSAASEAEKQKAYTAQTHHKAATTTGRADSRDGTSVTDTFRTTGLGTLETIIL